MSQAPAMPVFTDALIGDTTHLSAEEFGSYCLLLFATWRNNGQPLADNPRDLARICRVTARRWVAKLRARLAPFFDLSKGTWRQKRLEKEWQRCARLASISRSNGARGGRPQSSENKEIENPAGSNHTQGRKESKEETGSKGVAKQDRSLIKISDPVSRSAACKRPTAKIKDQLVQKLIRYCNARLASAERSAAILGLMGADQSRSAQSWLDALDQRMRAEKWDDTGEARPGWRRVA